LALLALPICLLFPLLSATVGCGGNSVPQIQSITFTADSAGTQPICTTAVSTQAGTTPLCTAALLPSLTAGGNAAFLFADVTNDDQVLGVSWTVTCGSAAPVGGTSIDTACGTFSPAETMSGPIPQYPITGIVTAYTPPASVPKGQNVILTAHATSLPSVTASVTLTIAAPPSGAGPASRRSLLSPLDTRTLSQPELSRAAGLREPGQ
jgi:hypothetical protein